MSLWCGASIFQRLALLESTIASKNFDPYPAWDGLQPHHSTGEGATVGGLNTVIVKEVVRCRSGGVSDFVVAEVALGVEADVTDRRPISDLA